MTSPIKTTMIKITSTTPIPDSSLKNALENFSYVLPLTFYENVDSAGNINNTKITTNITIIGASSFVLACSPFLFACSFSQKKLLLPLLLTLETDPLNLL